ncbi:MAG: FlgO family outer membrane protein [Nitrospinota bacterium]
MKKTVPFLLLLLAITTASGCRSFGYLVSERDKKPVYAERFNKTMEQMATELSSKMVGYVPGKTKVVVSTFVPVGSYEKAEAFGRICAEQMMMRLAEKNFQVIEIRKTPKILVRDGNGFFALSERLKNINKNIDTDLVLTGTYALVRGELIINAMLIHAENSRIVSSATTTIDVTDDEFITPLITPLVFGLDDRGGGIASKESIFMREQIVEGMDSSSKTLSLKIKKLSHDITRNVRKGRRYRSIIVSTFVDQDRLYRANSFGRYLVERLMDELNRRGFAVIETRAAGKLLVQPNIGEMALSRDAEEMMNKYEADAIVLGTYKKLGNVLSVNTRMIVSDNQEVVSVANMQIDLDDNDIFLNSLLANSLDRVSLQSEVEGFKQ